MSEVPFLDSSCLGPDLTTLNEEDLLRYFLNEDLDPSPFDSKVPSNNSPLLDPPDISLVSPLPKQAHISTPMAVKKEPTTPIKTNTKSRSKNQSTKQSTLAPPSLPLPSSSPASAPLQAAGKAFPSTVASQQPTKYTKPSTLIHPITVNAATTQSHDLQTVQVKVAATAAQTAPPPSLPSPSLPSPASGDDDKSVKRQRRLLKNRESAQLSRIRKKMYIDELERKVNALVSENSGLREEVGHLNDVLKQVAGTEGESATKAPLSRAEIMKAISSSNGTQSSSQARKYAGVCLLVVLFSLGLFLNVVPTNNNRQIASNRLLELDTHSTSHNKNNHSTNSTNNNNNNNNVHFRDYKMTKSTETDSIVSGTGRKESEDEDDHPSFSGKRSWDDDESDNFLSFPSHKRIKSEEYSTPMDTEQAEREDDEVIDEQDLLFDVLEDEAFSEDGILTTTSSSPSSPALSSGPSSPLPASPNSSTMAQVPSTPPVPAMGGPITPPHDPPSVFSNGGGCFGALFPPFILSPHLCSFFLP
eukprot:Phypoly_transcript_06048.p1 GENE.Phypoly_transcript_06048~~Phypoly_transcript_06048.p1  ORF type:complete len:529 (+),score=131.75 Phypoly_transcript_06048:178-1764(+)